MKNPLFLIILIFLASCSTKPPVEKSMTGNEDQLTQFFMRCRSDLDNARQVIVSQDIVKNLSHLQNMNAGGKKYYLLERENITRMLNAVTRGVYSDYILINAGGVVIYTRDNNEIFSKNVRSHLKNSVLEECYNKKAEGVYFSDVRRFSNFDGTDLVFVSGKVSGDNSFPGLLILQVDISKIMELVEPNTAIVGMDGTYRYHAEKNLIDTPCTYFSSIDTDAGHGASTRHLKLPEGRRITYRVFNYENVKWVFATEK